MEDTEKETPPVVVLEPEVATEEQPAPQKAKATEEVAIESPAIVEVLEKATSSRAQEATKSPTSEAIELVISDVRRAYPLPSVEFSGLLQMLEQAHKVSVLFYISE